MNASHASQPAQVQKTILVAEDEPLLRLVVAELLRMRGLIVVEASTAVEAEAVLSSGLTVDLVFTDVRMPGDFDGLELARRLVATRPGLPVLVTSGHLDGAGIGAGVAFLRKPYLPSDAVDLIAMMTHDGPDQA